MMTVPLLDMKLLHLRRKPEIEQAVARCLDHQQFILGPEAAAFEEELAAWLEVPGWRGVGTSSGTAALMLALRLLELQADDEVVVPAYSFMSTASTVALVGARPVFADVDPQTLNLTPEAMVGALTTKTRAVIAVHLFGRAADVVALRAALAEAGRSDVHIIEDAAQGLGARLDGQPVCTLGDVGCVSFFPAKNLGAYGDGGMAFVRTEAEVQQLRMVRQHGFAAKYNSVVLGYNARLDGMQAAILRAKLPDLHAVEEERRANAARYRALFAAASLPEAFALPSDDGADRRFYHVYNQFVVRAPRRDELAAYLDKRSIGSAVYYPKTLAQQPSLAAFVPEGASFPNAEAATRDSLALPIFPGLTEAQQDYVVASVANFYSEG